MKFLKEKKGIIISFIIGVIIASSMTVYATNYLARDIIYKDGKNVENALNELYNYKSNSKSLINIEQPMLSSEPTGTLTANSIDNSLISVINNNIVFNKNCCVDICIYGGANATAESGKFSGGIRIKKNNQNLEYQAKTGWTVNRVFSNILCEKNDQISFTGYLNTSSCTYSGIVVIIEK